MKQPVLHVVELLGTLPSRMNDRHPERNDPLKEPTGRAEEKFRELLDLIARLRSADGCPWDRSQTQADIGRYLIEEAYEVLEALDGELPPAAPGGARRSPLSDPLPRPDGGRGG